jgi:hypothetical protein
LPPEAAKKRLGDLGESLSQSRKRSTPEGEKVCRRYKRSGHQRRLRLTNTRVRCDQCQKQRALAREARRDRARVLKSETRAEGSRLDDAAASNSWTVDRPLRERPKEEKAASKAALWSGHQTEWSGWPR